MSVHGLLTPSVVLLVNLQYVREAVAALHILHNAHFKGKIYLFEHYLNKTDKQFLTDCCRKCGFIPTWRECGCEFIYDHLVNDKNASELAVTVALMPWILKEQEVIALGPDIKTKYWARISTKPKTFFYRSGPFSFSIFKKPIPVEKSCIYLSLEEIRKRFQFEDFLKFILPKI